MRLFSYFQCGLRQRDPAECGHQEVESTLPKCHTRQAGLQRIQAHEAGQPQKRE